MNSVPHHGLEEFHEVAYFNGGVSYKSRQLIDTMCNREFLDKQPKEAGEYLDALAENNQSWNYSDPSDKTNANLGPSSSEKFNVGEHGDLSLKVAQLTRKLETMELNKDNEVAAAFGGQGGGGVICDVTRHSTSDCHTIAAFKEVLHGVAQAEVNAVNQRFNPYSQTYNPGWLPDHLKVCLLIHLKAKGLHNFPRTNKGLPPPDHLKVRKVISLRISVLWRILFKRSSKGKPQSMSKMLRCWGKFVLS